MLKVFAADETDIDWMINLYLDGVQNGHFLLDMANQDYLKICQRNISSIVYIRQIIDFQLNAYAMIFEDNGTKVGYAVMSELNAGRGGNELHLFIVDKQYRHKGYGSLMLAEIIKRIQPVADLYVRCFPASSQMKSLLVKNGFRYSHTNNDSADVYILQKARAYA
jgi:GNAT superfamily N-acetyltransferase